MSTAPQYGYTASADEATVGPHFLRIMDINKSPWIDWSSVPYCVASGEDVEKCRVRVGVVLIARMADPGHGALIEEGVNCMFAFYLIRFRMLDKGFDRFIQYWLRSAQYWNLVAGRGAGTTRTSLNAKVLSAFVLVAPPASAAGTFSEMIDPLRSAVVGNVAESFTVATARDTLLPKLLEGNGITLTRL